MLLRDEHSGEIIAACGCELFEQSGALWGGAVASEHRRRGIQQMLIAHRLHLLRERGQRWATVASEPTIGTERNALRAGMRPAYTRLEMVRPGKGLIPSP
jgi:ribosomal protein S18 acetylase RimI-like enzyme